MFKLNNFNCYKKIRKIFIMNKIYLFILCIFGVFFNPNHSLSAFPKQSPEINGNFIKDLRYNTALAAKIGYGICALSFSKS